MAAAAEVEIGTTSSLKVLGRPYRDLRTHHRLPSIEKERKRDCVFLGVGVCLCLREVQKLRVLRLLSQLYILID